LQNPHVVESDATKFCDILRHELVSRLRQANHEIDDGLVGCGKICLGWVPPQLGGELLIQAGPAEKLDVAFQSVEALVLNRDD
jgi:hypothetical protein